MVLEGPCAAEVIGGTETRIDLVREFARRCPRFYAFMTGQVKPWAERSSGYADNKGWYGYLVFAALCQGITWQPQGEITCSWLWALVTVAAVGAVLVAGKRLQAVFDDILKDIEFPVLLVFWLRGTLMLRIPSQTQPPLSVPANADPAWPLQLRI